VSRTVTAALLVVLLAGSAACGGDGGPTNPSPPGGQDPSFQTINGNVQGFQYVAHQYNTSRAGNLTITLTWQGATDLDLYLTPAACQDVYGPNACARLAVSEQIVGNSESIARAVQSGEQFRVWVDNFATSAQAYTLTFDVK
jgi:hypothetical protein